MAKSHELEAFNRTLIGLDWENMKDLQDAVIERIRRDNCNPRNITPWATNIIHNIVAFNVTERKKVGQLNLGLGIPRVGPASGEKRPLGSPTDNSNGKKPALFFLEGLSKNKCYLKDLEGGSDMDRENDTRSLTDYL